MDSDGENVAPSQQMATLTDDINTSTNIDDGLGLDGAFVKGASSQPASNVDKVSQKVAMDDELGVTADEGVGLYEGSMAGGYNGGELTEYGQEGGYDDGMGFENENEYNNMMQQQQQQEDKEQYYRDQEQQQQDRGNDADFEDEEVLLPGVDDLPLFANPEARKIDLSIKEHEAMIEKTVSLVIDMKERIKVMKEHFKNVQQEVEHTNALYNAKNAEMQTEKHLRQLSSRALGRSRNESRKIQSEIETHQELLSKVQTDIYRANERMDEFKMQMNWKQEELEQWAVASKQKEEDALALQKYTRADELKIKELSMQLEQLTKEHLIKSAKLDNEAAETQARQKELDRVAVEFKKLHIERQSLVERWQETIDEMKRRDKEINDLGERYAIAKQERTRKEALVATQHKRLEAQKLENKEVESRSEILGRIVSKKREEMMTGNLKQQDFRDELDSLKMELTTAAESLVAKRVDNANKAQAIEEKRVQLERERQRYQQAKVKLEEKKQSKMEADELAKQAEDDLAQSERDYSAIISRVKHLKDKLFKEAQTAFELKKEEARMRAEINGSKVTTKNMETQLTLLDKEAARQQELLYNAEFQIQQIERKIARGMGERSDDEKRALRAQVEQAEIRKDQAKEKRKMLQAQVRKQQNELTANKARRDELQKTKVRMSEMQAEMELENRMLEDDIKKDVKSKEDMAIQNDLLRLEVRRLRDLLSAKADAVFSLENRRQQLLLSMEERKQEVSVHKDVLKAELKTLNEEKHQLTMDLRDREATVEKLKARFNAVARGEDEGHSQSYYIIKAAQKREELQRRGDELDQDVRKCEREIRALQTTLDHLNARNTAYRASFQKVELEGEDYEILKQLEERTKIGTDAVFRKKKELQRLVTDVEEDSRRVEQVRQQLSRTMKQKEHLEAAKQQVEEEILTQQTNLEEAALRIQRLVSKHRLKVIDSMGGDPALAVNTLEEKAASADVIKDVVQNVLFTLGQLAGEFPEVTELLSTKLKEADLRLPTKPAN